MDKITIQSISCEFYYATNEKGVDITGNIESFFNGSTFKDRVLDVVQDLDPYGLKYFTRKGDNCYGTFVVYKDKDQFTSADQHGNFGPLELKEGKELSSFFTFAYIHKLSIFVIHRWKYGGGKSYVQSYVRRKCNLANIFLYLIPTESGLQKLYRAKELGKASIRVATPSVRSLFYQEEGDIRKAVNKAYAYIANIAADVNAEEMEIVFIRGKSKNSVLNKSKLEVLFESFITHQKNDIESIKIGAKYPSEEETDIAIGDYSLEEIFKDRVRQLIDVKYPTYLLHTSPESVIEYFYDAIDESFKLNEAFLEEYIKTKKKESSSGKK